jgi:hypothetical protein
VVKQWPVQPEPARRPWVRHDFAEVEGSLRCPVVAAIHSLPHLFWLVRWSFPESALHPFTYELHFKSLHQFYIQSNCTRLEHQLPIP